MSVLQSVRAEHAELRAKFRETERLLARSAAMLDQAVKEIRRHEPPPTLAAHEVDAVIKYANKHGIKDGDEALRRYKTDPKAREAATTSTGWVPPDELAEQRRQQAEEQQRLAAMSPKEAFEAGRAARAWASGRGKTDELTADDVERICNYARDHKITDHLDAVRRFKQARARGEV